MKVDEKIEKYLITEVMGRYLDKKELKLIGYKETKAECCGTCMHYKGIQTCKNLENMAMVSSLYDIALPVSAGLNVSPRGICPRYHARW